MRLLELFSGTGSVRKAVSARMDELINPITNDFHIEQLKDINKHRFLYVMSLFKGYKNFYFLYPWVIGYRKVYLSVYDCYSI
jgi:hypothetical protein